MNESTPMLAHAASHLCPEYAVIAALLIACLWNLFFPKLKEATAYICIAGLGLASFFLTQQLSIDIMPLFKIGEAYPFVIDKLTVAFGLIACMVGIICIFMTMGYEQHFGDNRGEFYAILMAAIVSVMILAGTVDMVLLFVALETLTLCCILLSGFAKRDRRSNEAALKYLLSTAATTATFLYGISFVYGLTGSTCYMEIKKAIFPLAQSSPSLLFIMLMVLLISAIGFKLSMVPFHMWTPDVYEGSPTPVTAFLSVGSKLGGFVVALRLLTVCFDAASANWTLILGSLAILCMIVGNIIALAQTSLKRMLAYSSIAHVGYLLIGLVTNGSEGLAAMVFYIIVYGFMNLGAFTAAVLFSNETGSDKIDDYAGLIRKRPYLALGLAVCLLNLAGLPVPPAGFLAKVFVFWSGFQLGTPLGYSLVCVALVTSVPAIFYYSRVIIKMIVRDPSDKVIAMADKRPQMADPQYGPQWALALSLAGILAASLIVNPIMHFSRDAVKALGKTPVVGSLPGTTPQ